MRSGQALGFGAVEAVGAMQLASNFQPQELLNTSLSPGESGYRDIAVVDCDPEFTQDSSTQMGVFCQQACGDHVVGLAASHRLFKS